jgi:hypothetical protein
LRIKSPPCYQLHHNPANRSGVSVSIAMRTALSFSFMLAVSSVVAPGIEPTPCGLKVRCAASYTTTLCSVGRIRFNRSADNIVFLLLVRGFISGSPGNRTQRNAVISRVWATSPRLPCGSGISARTLIAVGREALESSSPGLQPSAIPSQLPARLSLTTRKKPGVVVTPGFVGFP